MGRDSLPSLVPMVSIFRRGNATFTIVRGVRNVALTSFLDHGNNALG